jgi:hypothetical protein
MDVRPHQSFVHTIELGLTFKQKEKRIIRDQIAKAEYGLLMNRDAFRLFHANMGASTARLAPPLGETELLQQLVSGFSDVRREY